ncbi:MAG: T9SS C-terminal target domain-containing protein [Ignavibacteriales bacterium]|nr:MAG: T9SS C-terminal target domain-containing protein [Ignavibacteriales bacterium]
MKIKWILFLSFLITALFILSKNFAQIDEVPSGYFPLKIGYRWTYTYKTITVNKEIVAIARFDGKFYYGMRINDSDYLTFFRVSNDTVYTLDTVNHRNESPIFILNANVGDRLTIHPDYICNYGSSTVFYGGEDTVSTFVENFTQCFHFYHIKKCMDAGALDSWLAKDVGLIKFISDSYFGVRTWTLSSYSTSTSVNSNSDSKISSFKMYDNFPNPFNPTTAIKFDLPEACNVELIILDILGREIRTLVNEYKTTGSCTAIWDSKDYLGNDVSSGIYFYNIRFSDYSQTKKMVLLR